MKKNLFSGLILGYDPGGNGGHGLAVAEYDVGSCAWLSTETLLHAEAVIDRLESLDNVAAIGIDTLACWGTGPSGWRPADLRLRKTYEKVRANVVSPNGLYGSMALNGMAVIQSARKHSSAIQVTETDPKVLYWALAGRKYDYAGNAAQMQGDLSRWLGTPIVTKNDHEWDAALSVLAAVHGLEGDWTHDLFTEATAGSGRLLFAEGPAHYWWLE